MANGKEKRQFFRHPLEVPVRITASSRVTPAHHCDTRNVSEGGICFLSNHPIKKGSEIRVDIPVRDQLFKLYATVAYSAKDESSGLYQTGVAFQDALSLYRAKLAEEIISIQKYCDTLQKRSKRKISLQEAEKKWVQKHARQFASLFKD